MCRMFYCNYLNFSCEVNTKICQPFTNNMGNRSRTEIVGNISGCCKWRSHQDKNYVHSFSKL